jgi:hypothetical protein
MERKRHDRKYAEGNLGADLSFYFRGPDDALKLRAQNLIQFIQLGEGVDDATWEYHLRHGDYTRWFEEIIKNKDLVKEAEEIEKEKGLTPAESRERLRTAIEKRYTLPANAD